MLYRSHSFSYRMVGWTFLFDWASKSLVLPIQSQFSSVDTFATDFTSPISASFAMKRVLQALSNRFADKQTSEASADR